MKTYSFKLSQSLKERILSPIRTKYQLVLLLLNAVKAIRVNHVINDSHAVGQITLSISKMSRITFFLENKVFSFAFPFKVIDSDGILSIQSTSIGEIDSVVISEAIQILSNETIQNASCISEFATLVLEKGELRPGFWLFIKELLFMEDGYIRYDIDPERKSGHIHPEHHLDVFYTSKVTFKVGLEHPLNDEELLNILNVSTECHYLSPPYK